MIRVLKCLGEPAVMSATDFEVHPKLRWIDGWINRWMIDEKAGTGKLPVMGISVFPIIFNILYVVQFL